MQKQKCKRHYSLRIRFFVRSTTKKICFTLYNTNIPEYPYQSFIQILIHNSLNHPLTLVKGFIGYTEQDIALNHYQTTKYRIYELTEFHLADNFSLCLILNTPS